MGIVFHSKPEVERPVLIACWPGIGNIGIIATDTLRAAVRADSSGDAQLTPQLSDLCNSPEMARDVVYRRIGVER